MEDFEIPARLIPRPAYLDRMRPFMRKSIAKVLTGQRRVGKSYLLYQLMQMVLEQDESAHILYINKENIAFDLIRTAADLNRYILERTVPGRMNYLFVDEVQEIAGFEKAIRSFLLAEKYDVYITGSNANLLSGELATLLGGRTVEFSIHSLSYLEFLTFHGLEDSGSALLTYMKYGGLPYLVNLELTDEVVFEYLKNIYTTILYRDVVARHKVRNTHFLEQLVKFLADTTGSLFSAKSISDFLKSQKVNMAHNQVQTFIGHLSDAFLIGRVPRFDIKGKRIFEVGEKYYFENTGIRNVIAGYRTDDQSKLLENVIYNHLQYKGYKIYVGQHDNREIDFIATKEGRTLYIQAALKLDSEKTIERELGNLHKVRDHFPKLVVTLEGSFQPSHEGIVHLSLREFLRAY